MNPLARTTPAPGSTAPPCTDRPGTARAIRALARAAWALGVCSQLAGPAAAAAAADTTAAAAAAADARWPRQAAQAAPANAKVQPDIAARFRVTLQLPGGRPQHQQWQLTRTATEITWIKGPGAEEIWRRDASGIRLERVLRPDRHLIDYSAGELRALAVALDWRELGSLFAEADLVLLGPAAASRPGQPAHYRGRIQAEQVDLLWDPVARLPIRLARSGRSGRVVFERTALHAAPPAGWPRAGAGSEGFQRLDAADFGDMADNPVVRKAQAGDERAGWRQRHAD